MLQGELVGPIQLRILDKFHTYGDETWSDKDEILQTDSRDIMGRIY